MKKLYTFIALAFIGFFGNAQIINFPDATFKFWVMHGAKNINMQTFTPDVNGDGELSIAEAATIYYLQFSNINVTISDTSGIEYLVNLRRLNCGGNNIASLDLRALSNLERLDCSSSHLNSLNITGLHNLTAVEVNSNNLTNVDLTGVNALTSFSAYNNHLQEMDFSGCPNLSFFSVDYISRLNIKNGTTQDVTYCSFGSQNLTHICVDESELANIQNKVNLTYAVYANNIQVNSYCSFVPGGTYYTVQGISRLDINGNGCDISDIGFPNMRYNAVTGTTSGSFIAANTGNYAIELLAGTTTITPQLENPQYFTVSPPSVNITFPQTATNVTRNFCLSPNGTHNDLEVEILPIGRARPGSDNIYKIIYKNKGNLAQNGTISATFYDPIEDFVSAEPNFSSQSTNTLNWNFTNLLPFETRVITVIFNLNSPIEVPSVNAGNIITHTASISGAIDETPDDNFSALNQTAINSFDPNDKSCAEGDLLPVTEVGKYMHYIIKFENTGTANAENIVIKDMIDTARFDINTLVPLSASHNFKTKISLGNKVEFIFENINLPFDDANNDGYVAFKIKTLPNLVEGNIINNSANIYFDYNFPIVTQPFSTTVYNPLSNDGFEFNSVFSLSPVPAKDNLTIKPKQSVIISSVSIYNTLGQLIQVNTNPSETIDVSGLRTGSYFIKIISDKGTAGSKFIKE